MMPLYIWVATFVGYFHDKPWLDLWSGSLAVTALVVVGAALAQLLEVPFGSTVGLFIFRLAVIDARGEPVRRGRLLKRWAFAWLPLLVPLSVVALLTGGGGRAAMIMTVSLLLLGGAAAVYAVLHPHRGLHDRLADTWVVRR
jgi:uncharacterized RDD family membrane protein YckC